MPKRRILNGLPHNLVQLYFYSPVGSDLADLLYHTARKHNITEITLDILTGQIEPRILLTAPFQSNLIRVKTLLEQRLQELGFTLEYIAEVEFRIEVPANKLLLFCWPSMHDVVGRTYQTKRMAINVYSTHISALYRQAEPPSYSVWKAIKAFFRHD
jgi:hypothetical protein